MLEVLAGWERSKSMVGGCWRDNVGEERRWATSSIIRTRQVVQSDRAQPSCAWAEGLTDCVSIRYVRGYIVCFIVMIRNA